MRSTALNESVQSIIREKGWRTKSLVEADLGGRFFLITEGEFNQLLESEQLNEGVKDLIQKAWKFAKTLPADATKAAQVVAQKTGQAWDKANQYYVKAQQMIDKVPLIGKLGWNTRNRILMGLAITMAAGIGSEVSAGEHGGHVDVSGGGGGDHAAAGGDHLVAGGGDHHAAAGDPPVAGGGDAAPAPTPGAGDAAGAGHHAIDTSGVDTTQEVISLKQAVAKAAGNNNIYGDKMAGQQMSQMLALAKKAGTATDANDKAEMVKMIKSIAKTIMTKTDPNNADIQQALAKAVGAAMKGAQAAGK